MFVVSVVSVITKFSTWPKNGCIKGRVKVKKFVILTKCNVFPKNIRTSMMTKRVVEQIWNNKSSAIQQCILWYCIYKCLLVLQGISCFSKKANSYSSSISLLFKEIIPTLLKKNNFMFFIKLEMLFKKINVSSNQTVM